MIYTPERDKIWKQIEEANIYYIYGAQVVAYGVYAAIKEVLGKYPEAFLVSSMANNPLKIEHIPVIEINGNIDSNALIIVATPEIYHEEIKDKLQHFNLNNILFVD